MENDSGIILKESTRSLSPEILKTLCLRFDGKGFNTGICALLHRDNRIKKKNIDILRKEFKSSEFNSKS